MITINTVNKYSEKVYLRYIIPCLVILFFISLSGGGLSEILGIYLALSLIIGLPYSLFFFLRINSYSYIVTDNSITQNYGIITKKSETITFDKIQNIKCFSGIINRLFHLTQLSIWTASPSQSISYKGTSQNEPNIVLILDITDADWIKNYILNKKASPPIQTTPTSTSL